MASSGLSVAAHIPVKQAQLVARYLPFGLIEI